MECAECDGYLSEQFGFIAHIQTRGEEILEISKVPGFSLDTGPSSARTAGTNRFRGLLIRWPKQTSNYLTCLHLCAG